MKGLYTERSDKELLGEFVDSASEDAFVALVRRHADMVHSVCYRCLPECAHLVEDAAQAVFVVLAQKAPSLRGRASVGGWLYRTARYAALDVRRREMRRRRREREAAERARRRYGDDRGPADVVAQIDEAMVDLRPRQREVIVLHYLRGMKQKEIAEKLGCSVNAVRKREGYAIRKLRAALRRRGTPVSAAALAGWLSQESSRAAPASLVAACGAAGAANRGSVSPAARETAKGVTAMMFWKKVHIGIATLGGAAAAVLLSGLAILGGAEKTTEPAAVQPTETGSGIAVAGEGIPVAFTLRKPGFVTLVIDDADGRRICNLLNDTFFPAGNHAVWWDGYNAGDKQSKEDGFDVHRHRVAPGRYVARGLSHEDITLRYETAVQSPGDPPWHTPDGSGGWLADHTPPIDVLYLPGGSPHGEEPQIMAAASGSEAGHGVIWLGPDGAKRFGRREGAWALGRDAGSQPGDEYYAYALTHRGVYAFRRGADHAGDDCIRLYPMKFEKKGRAWHTNRPKYAIAACNGTVLVSCYDRDRILFLDAAQRKAKEALVGEAAVDDPRGMAFGADGGLYLITGTAVRRFQPDLAARTLGDGRAVITELENPFDIAVAPGGSIYVSDWGASHQVKVFDRKGKLLRSIGKPGGKQFGLYDEERMHRPAGLALDGKGRLWVAEHDYAPKRISVWDARTGRFLRAFYGPPKYGGGGHLDPRDRTRFYYSSRLQGIEYAVDWETGTSRPRSIYALEGVTKGRTGDVSVYRGGRHYLINTFYGPAYFVRNNADVFIYDDAKGTARRAAHVGHPGKSVEEGFFGEYAAADPALRAALEREVYQGHFKSRFCAWADENLDGVPQAGEIQGVNFGMKPVKRDFGGVTMGPDLSIALTSGIFIPAPAWRDNGVPVWDLKTHRPFADRGEHLSDVVHAGDRFIFTMGGYARARVVRAYRDGRLDWKINGVGGAGRPDPLAAFTGQLVNAQRSIGFPFTPPQGDGGTMFALNGYRGNVYLLTADGLYVTDIGGDIRTNVPIGPPTAERGMIIDDYSWGDEHFWPAIDQMEDGIVYFTAGGRCENLVFTVLGLDTIRRLAPRDITVSPGDLAGKPTTMIVPGELRKKHRAMTVAVTDILPTVDGDLTDWGGADWVTIDPRRGIAGAVAVGGGRLYAAWRTRDPRLLNNNLADGWRYAFASGGGLDLMIRTDPSVKRVKRHKWYGRTKSVVPGDLRLFVTRTADPVSGPVRAVCFRQRGGEGAKTTYTSPVGRVDFDAVTDISTDVALAQRGGCYELSIPLATIGLAARPGVATLGDIGVLVGNGSETMARVYWNNKASTMVSDIPTEARLLPHEWGTWTFAARDLRGE